MRLQSSLRAAALALLGFAAVDTATAEALSRPVPRVGWIEAFAPVADRRVAMVDAPVADCHGPCDRAARLDLSAPAA
jgi:hypothetical protein